jgi:hypothetical protein
MLIVAQPKSSSTSLLATLREVSGLTSSAQQCYIDGSRVRDCFSNPPEFPVLREIHSDVANYEPSFLDQWTDADVFFKQHVVPSPHNLSLLQEKRYVILRRDPEASYQAYLRSLQFMDGFCARYTRFRLLEDRSQSVRKELETFHERYQDPPGETLALTYENVTKRPARTVSCVLDFFGVSYAEGEDVELARRRYSRDERRWWRTPAFMRIVDPFLRPFL